VAKPFAEIFMTGIANPNGGALSGGHGAE
jgi:hypothetical protein